MNGGSSDAARKAGATSRPLSYADLFGWTAEDHEAALRIFRVTIDKAFPQLRRAAEGPAKAFFETYFEPVIHGDGQTHFTGYYEPEIEASLRPTDEFAYPIYEAPPDLVQPWHTRAEIEDNLLLAGRNLEIAWLRDPVEVFFLQVQGSGRLRFADGSGLRVGFAAKNGHDYASIGQELIRRGEIAPHLISAESVKQWVRENGPHILRHNPSYVFFRVLDLPDESGPLGSMGRPVTAHRSIAVDPRHVPLGSAVWTVIEGKGSLRIAQDIGSAIQGANRADLFCGTGDAAGQMAGTLNTHGFMVTLRLREQP